MPYEIKTEHFAGPLEKLLELVEAQDLDVTLISIARVTGDFINYIKTLGDKVDHKTLADFVAMASRLILIKSKALLPNLELTKEEEADIKDLENKLSLYKEFKNAGKLLAKLFSTGKTAYAREFLQDTQNVFNPPISLDNQNIFKNIRSVLGSLEFLDHKEEKEVAKILVTLEEKISELVIRMQKIDKQSFKDLAIGKSKGEIVVLFLALLHLLKTQNISMSQKNHFDDIIIKNL